MKKSPPRSTHRLWLILLALGLAGLAWGAIRYPVQAEPAAQIPTGTIPTVTGTPTGPIVTVRMDIDQPSINVRAGPGTTYDKVGLLLLGEKAVAKGRSPGGTWIMIAYPVAGGVGWVSADLVSITPGSLPVFEAPPTPTPLYTVTIDPTMAAQFVVTVAPTRLPTYTPPPALAIPTFTLDQATDTPSGVPMGLIIIGLAAIGLFLGLFALAQGR